MKPPLTLITPAATVTPTTPLDYALEYARIGLKVFPQHTVRDGSCSCDRGDACQNPGKHPLHMVWQDEATSDSEHSRNIWTKTPWANVGVVLGRASNAFELDVDARRNGLAALGRLEAEHGPLPRTPTQRSGSGGRKYLFLYPDIPVPNSTEIEVGIEILGDRHATTLPPSRNKNGSYEWLPGLAPWEIPMAAAPGWLLDTIPNDRIYDGGEHPAWIENLLVRHFGTFDREKEGWLVRCPAGERHANVDAHPSLWLTVAESGILTPYCRTRKCHEKPPVGLGKAALLARAGITKTMRRAPDRKAPVLTAVETGADTRPVIRITPELHEVHDAAVEALARAENLYVRGKELARVVRGAVSKMKRVDRPPDTPTFQRVAPETLQEILAAVAVWEKESRGGWVQVPPPLPVAKAVLARGEWPGVPVAESIVDSPVILADGSILDTPGLHPDTGLIYESGGAVPSVEIGENPAEDGAHAVMKLIAPFVTYRWADRDAALPALLAAILTPIARHLIAGPVPMFAVSAPQARSGKGKLVRAVSTIAIGRDPAAFVGWKPREEYDKLFTAIAQEGDRIISLDNVVGTLRSPELAYAITEGTYRAREFGQNRRTLKAPWVAVVFANGNNLRLATDLSYRSVPIEINWQTERPDLLQFEYDVVQKVRQERPALYAAALKFLAAYIRAGKPKPGTPWCDFSEWDAAVRQAVIWGGLGDPLVGREKLIAEGDDDLDLARQVFAAWVNAHGGVAVTTAEAIGRAGTDDVLRAALAQIDPRGDGIKLNPRVIGSFFKSHRDRIVGGMKLVEAGKSHGVALWKVERPEEGRPDDA